MTSVPEWVQRGFEFDFDAAMYPNVLARLAGTPARVDEIVRGVPREGLIARIDGKWSLQENVGHLINLEELLTTRLDEFLGGAEKLTAADMSNANTESAHYNERLIAPITADFRAVRTATMSRLDALGPAEFSRVALHPRLNKPMRLVDMLFFMAEHDDHHLARARELRALVT